jgi:hypothetical protein
MKTSGWTAARAAERAGAKKRTRKAAVTAMTRIGRAKGKENFVLSASKTCRTAHADPIIVDGEHEQHSGGRPDLHTNRHTLFM